ncbi:hypothetical protein [Amycolatopsis sp. lyj-23]|uniref:hypothetical protein n=1 Tax=Amycolatopsis sp. lyj-23 TaxID=2789283 RepID=UPI00397CFAAB
MGRAKHDPGGHPNRRSRSKVIDAVVSVMVEDPYEDPQKQALRFFRPEMWTALRRDAAGGSVLAVGDVATLVKLLTGDLRRIVATAVVITLLHQLGLPLPLAKVIGKLVAGWLFARLGGVDAWATRVQVVGVLAEAANGEPADCAYLAGMMKQFSENEFGRRLQEGPGPGPGKPPGPWSTVDPMPPRSNPDPISLLEPDALPQPLWRRGDVVEPKAADTAVVAELEVDASPATEKPSPGANPEAPAPVKPERARPVPTPPGKNRQAEDVRRRTRERDRGSATDFPPGWRLADDDRQAAPEPDCNEGDSFEPKTSAESAPAASAGPESPADFADRTPQTQPRLPDDRLILGTGASLSDLSGIGSEAGRDQSAEELCTVESSWTAIPGSPEDLPWIAPTEFEPNPADSLQVDEDGLPHPDRIEEDEPPHLDSGQEGIAL